MPKYKVKEDKKADKANISKAKYKQIGKFKPANRQANLSNRLEESEGELHTFYGLTNGK